MTEIIGVLFLAAIVLGAVLARWWIVMVPFADVAAWVAVRQGLSRTRLTP